jgi:hypothetical protein
MIWVKRVSYNRTTRQYETWHLTYADHPVGTTIIRPRCAHVPIDCRVGIERCENPPETERCKRCAKIFKGMSVKEGQ